jgi:hypothetical protein
MGRLFAGDKRQWVRLLRVPSPSVVLILIWCLSVYMYFNRTVCGLERMHRGFRSLSVWLHPRAVRITMFIFPSIRSPGCGPERPQNGNIPIPSIFLCISSDGRPMYHAGSASALRPCINTDNDIVRERMMATRGAQTVAATRVIVIQYLYSSCIEAYIQHSDLIRTLDVKRTLRLNLPLQDS